MLLAAMGYIITGALVKHLAGRYSVFEVAFFRSAFAVILLAPMIYRIGLGGFRTQKFPLHVLRAVMGYLGIMCWFYGVSRIPLSDYYALQFTTPLFTIAGAVLVLGERSSVRHWLAVFVGFGGALVILRPGFNEVGLGGLAAIAAAVSFAAVNNTIRFISRTDSTAVIVVYANLMIILISAVPAVPGWVTPSWVDLLWMAAVGLFGTIAQYSITRAVSVAEARVVQPFDFARLPFAALVGYLVFAELPDGWTWIGAVIIFAAGYYVLQLERRPARST